MNEELIKSLEKMTLKDIKDYEKETDQEKKDRLLKNIVIEIKNLNVKEKEMLDFRKLEFEMNKYDHDCLINNKKMIIEKSKYDNDEIKNERKMKKEEIMKYLEFSLKVLGISLPLLVSIIMWYGQNRLIYIDDGRATPELKDIIKSVNKKIF